MRHINALEYLRMTTNQKLEALRQAYKNAETQEDLIEIIKFYERLKATV